MKKPEIHILNEGEVFDKNRYKAIFGDFDKDGIDNLDDPNPTKKGDTATVEERQLVDGMSKLLTIKNNLDITMHHAVKDLAAVAPKDSKIYARTKTPYSIVQKLIEKRLIVPSDYKKGLTDLIGTTIAVDNYADILKMRDLIENGKIYQVYEVEDFYKNPLNGYMAIHYILIYKDEKGTFPVELQLKTKRMKAINEISHGAYATHNLNKNRLLECTSLANRADKGDETAIKEFNHLMEDKDKLKDSFYLNAPKKYKTGGDVENSIKEGQVYLNTTNDKHIIIDKIEDSNNDYPSVHYHIADEPKSYRNSNIDRISLFENLVENGAFVLQNNTYKNGGDLESEWQEIGKYAEGGGLENFTTVEEYFKNLPFDKLPKEFSDYVKTEILTDTDLKHLSQNEPIFVQIKDKVDGYLKPVETTESVAPNKNLALRIKLLRKNLEKDPSNISIKTRIKLLSKNLSK
jgi:ppGpp synthetase/RelA/SpoT-type nucleotidyltranferase